MQSTADKMDDAKAGLASISKLTLNVPAMVTQPEVVAMK